MITFDEVERDTNVDDKFVLPPELGDAGGDALRRIGDSFMAELESNELGRYSCCTGSETAHVIHPDNNDSTTSEQFTMNNILILILRHQLNLIALNLLKFFLALRWKRGKWRYEIFRELTDTLTGSNWLP